MDVYVIYKFSDKEIVYETVKKLSEQYKDVSFFLFKPEKKTLFWRMKARKKIQKCNFVIFIDSLDRDETHVKNILWELKYAEKLNKRTYIFRTQNGPLSSRIYCKKDYSEDRIDPIRYQPRPLDDIYAFFNKETEWSIEKNLLTDYYVKLHREASESDDPKRIEKYAEEKRMLLEQYRIMIDTTEKMMERRQQLGTLYTTICTGLLAFLGATFAFQNILVSAITAFASGIIIFFFCDNWKKSLTAYDLNNRGKFEVINEIEKSLPAIMFECEYRYNTKNGIKSYSNRERILPNIFKIFGILVVGLSLYMVIQFVLTK